jgi:hypothetical protein
VVLGGWSLVVCPVWEILPRGIPLFLSCSVVILVVVALVLALGMEAAYPPLPMEDFASAQLFILALGLSAIALAILKLSYREA